MGDRERSTKHACGPDPMRQACHDPTMPGKGRYGKAGKGRQVRAGKVGQVWVCKGRGRAGGGMGW